ncbi:MAG: phenylalanine--tRNA ligase subunit alpha [Candidatus Cloacimonadaceae bacterium]|nr:phenylalanine--tRNA ligase subunit alpha [Candidatus Cloacimonadota bacterium]MDD4033931.1 phenylalanine--tRNA ligase subunit alpha [Candidatus Cloacimonadota bacterium]MDY0337217.1 phenylalanine--tRNA ligase subunit alpha [Candidatus Cloacimonadaceae bacterium]
MQNQLATMLEEAGREIEACATANDILNTKAKYLGKKSLLNGLYGRMKDLEPSERPAFGNLLNEARQQLETLLNAKSSAIKAQSWKKENTDMDFSMPGMPSSRGGYHPLSIVRRQIDEVFISLGFEIAEGLDIEDEFHNFDALNTPADHPSRNLADTFYVEGGRLLRTQTSTVQIRVMESYQPPIRIISPGRCYRNDKPDPSHSPVFHQVEALVVDKGISMSDLTDTLQNFASIMFGASVRSRIRPHFFPFTEPSAEMDISCVACSGAGCRVCKGSGWLEMGGAGMVDPNVFDILGIDSEIYTGFAFGLGIERIAMLKYNIPDMRILFENDLRMLNQFRGEL